MHPGSTPRARLHSRRSKIVSKIAALAIVAAALACATMEKAIVAEPGVAFSLPLGQTATLRGSSARITFAQVREDSRCPVDVTCVWAGDAKIELTVSSNGSGNDVRVLSLTPEQRNIVWRSAYSFSRSHPGAATIGRQYASRLRRAVGRDSGLTKSGRI